MKVSDFDFTSLCSLIAAVMRRCCQAAKEKLTGLLGQLAAAEAAASSSSVPDDANAADDDAQAMLDGDELPSSDKQAGLAWRRVHALRRAIELQRAEIARQRSKASETICVDARPMYEAILRKQSAAVEKLVEAHKAEREFRETLDNGDVSFTHLIRPCGFLGSQDVPDDAERWFKELQDSGYKV